jgi:glycogen(starch) synthase
MPGLLPAPLPFAAPRLLCLGRVVVQKGFDVALRAFAQLAGRYPQARLVVAGDGEALSALVQLAGALGIAGAVEFPGWAAPGDVPALINCCTMVLMPSRYEPFGLVALQAGQMARPVVASRVDGLPEVVVDGETGLLVEPENPEALARAIVCLLEDPALAARMGQAGRRRAEEAFSWEHHLEAYEALFQHLARNAKRDAAH